MDSNSFPSPMNRRLLSASFALALASVAQGQTVSTAPTLAAPGQPQRTGIPGGFEIIGESLVSAQQVRQAVDAVRGCER